MDFRTTADYFPQQHRLVGHCNGEVMEAHPIASCNKGTELF